MSSAPVDAPRRDGGRDPDRDRGRPDRDGARYPGRGAAHPRHGRPPVPWSPLSGGHRRARPRSRSWTRPASPRPSSSAAAPTPRALAGARPSPTPPAWRGTSARGSRPSSTRSSGSRRSTATAASARRACSPAVSTTPSTPGRATILRAALDMAAIRFVLAHNHPSGDPTPTGEDQAMTQELRDLSCALNVPLQAHVIVTPSGRYPAVLE